MHAGTPAERVDVVASRTADALATMAARHPDEQIGAVSHSVPIRALISRLKGIDDDRFWTMSVPTCSVTELWIDSGTIEIVALPKPSQAP
jgi:broad specificity phosphatase PhoE